MYHKPVKELKEDILLGIKLWADAEEELKVAVKILKKNIKEIFNFRHIIPEKIKK